MRVRDRLIIIFCLVAAAGFLWLGGSQLDYINNQRSNMNLVSTAPLENAPPSLAFVTVAMGAFRGLVVDILWIRADSLKQKGQYFDAKQLAEWITMLQPRFAAVWDFQAWNMAYNLSVAMPATQPQERWRWVRNGYELLRDRGIPQNPRSIQLYRSLAWIFQHKIGGITDDVHKYYQFRMYESLKPLLGDESNEYFRMLADEPNDIAVLLKDPLAAEYLAALEKADARLKPDEDFVVNYVQFRQTPAAYDSNAFKAVEMYRETGIVQKLDLFSRANFLRREWKLEPKLMVDLNRLYGPVNLEDPNNPFPLPWTHPQVHAIYWAIKGLRAAGNRENTDEYSIDELNTDRIVFHSLQALYRSGKIVVYPPDPCADPANYDIDAMFRVFLMPDLRFYERYNDYLEKMIVKYAKFGNEETLAGGHRNFLINAVSSFYQAGHIKKAGEIYQYLRQKYPREEFNVPLVVFARERLKEELRDIGIDDAREIIIMMLREAYFRYSIRDDDEAAGREKMAQEVYDYYHSQFGDVEFNRLGIPSMNRMRYLAINDFLNDMEYPENLRRNLLARIKIERPELFDKLQQEHKQYVGEQKQEGND